MLPFDRRHSNPSRGQDASKLAMREERDVAFQLVKMGDEPISTVGNLRGRFAARTTVPKHVPVWMLLANVHGALYFVIAIGSISAAGPSPANSHVRRARCRGLVSTRANWISRR
jgi:hypothetical protein